MSFISNHYLKVWVWSALPLLALCASACSDDDNELVVLPTEIKLTDTGLQSSYTIPDDGTITVTGKGFNQGDAISLTDSTSTVYNGIVRQVTDESLAFGVDATFPQKGYYTVRVHRGADERVLGSTAIELVCDFGVQGIVVDPRYTVMVNHTMKIAGEGFLATDRLQFTDTKSSEAYNGTTAAADATGIEVKLPIEMAASSYNVTMTRNGRTALLGTATIEQVADTEMEPKAGATIMGTVYCGYEPVAGAVVSDGVTLTRTDANGHYWLNSPKSRGTVFISVPANYTVPLYKGTNTPHHYELLTEAPGVLEQHNFELIAENQRSFTLLGIADSHLANRDNDDIKQFQKGFLVDVNQTIQEIKATGEPVYGITLGDLSWDTYWYKYSYTFADAVKELYKVECPVYNCTGNHDHDIQIHSDYEAAKVYIETTGPTYYSFNLGSTHVIVLDNIVYGAQSGDGAESCRYYFETVQWEWLKRDLATIENRNNPVVVCMHHALHRYPSLDANGNAITVLGLDDNAGNDLVRLLADYTNVKVLTGHTHVNYDGSQNNGTLHEQNIASVCGTWWWTGASGYAGNNLCRDGIPGGYAIMEVDGPSITGLDYKSTGYPRDYQFRAVDLNQVYITLARYAPAATYVPTEAESAELLGGYDVPNTNNEVLINVFNYGLGWSISVVEEDASGRKFDLTPQRVMAKDPTHVISYQMPYINKINHYPTAGMVTIKSTKIFKVRAGSATSTLHITVTDPYGKVYTEKMVRPKLFHANMQ